MTPAGTTPFGGGLTEVVVPAMADLTFSGDGLLDVDLSNLGLLSNTNSMSGLLSFDTGLGYVEQSLGVDLNGDGLIDNVRINDLIFAGFGPTSPQFTYTDDPVLLDQVEIELVTPLSLSGSGQINPPFAYNLDVQAWTMTQEITVPAQTAIPEPSSTAFCILGAFGFLAYRFLRRKRAA